MEGRFEKAWTTEDLTEEIRLILERVDTYCELTGLMDQDRKIDAIEVISREIAIQLLQDNPACSVCGKKRDCVLICPGCRTSLLSEGNREG